MREIKFRGKRFDNGEWIEGSLLITELVGELEPPHYFICPISEEGMYRVIPESAGQFTGLYDRNGKRIFEGDLAREKSFAHVLEIVWDKEECGFMARSVMTHMCYSINNKFKIIGNIHDNPELLGETP